LAIGDTVVAFASELERKVFDAISSALKTMPNSAYKLHYTRVENPKGFHGCDITIKPKKKTAATLVISVERDFKELHLRLGNSSAGEMTIRKNDEDSKIRFIVEVCVSAAKNGMLETTWTHGNRIVFSKGTVEVLGKKKTFFYGRILPLLFFWRYLKAKTSYESFV
jgi:hypothetical protein